MRAGLLALPLSALLATEPSHAQSALTRDEQNVVNFAFATQLGSGVYSVSGRTLQIYRLPFGHELKPAGPDGVGVVFTLPVTFGFYDFKLQDVAGGDLPARVDAVSVVPGLKFVYEVREGWHVEPYVEAGVSKARDVEADSTVYSGGLVSRYDFEGAGYDWQLRNDLVFAGVDLHGPGGSDHFTRFQTVFSARRPFGRNPRVDYLVYALNDWYLDPPEGPVGGGERSGSALQYEVGLTLGSAETRRIWRIPLPRVGLGYRFGSDIGVYRVVFGTPF
jgi:hypothetical protein